MQEKVIKIPFNSKYFIESHRIIWTFSNKRHIKPYLTYTALGILCLAIGLIGQQKERFPITIIIGGGYLFSMILTWLGFLERRIKYFKKIKSIALRYEQEVLECTYTFSDVGFEYMDKEKLMKFNWSLFGTPHIFKDTIMVVLKNSGAVNFTIGKYEVGDEVYHELWDILNTKISKG